MQFQDTASCVGEAWRPGSAIIDLAPEGVGRVAPRNPGPLSFIGFRVYGLGTRFSSVSQ